MNIEHLDIHVAFTRSDNPMLEITIEGHLAIRFSVSHIQDMRTRGWLAGILKQQVAEMYLKGKEDAREEVVCAWGDLMTTMGIAE